MFEIATTSELSKAAASEGIAALGLNLNDELTVEMVCELSNDFLKLAALY
jgi:hypothetical protein